MSQQANTTFTADHLDTLRREFSTIKRIDPCQPTYAKMTRLLDSLSPEQLQQFADAGIKFVSVMAKTRLIRNQAR